MFHDDAVTFTALLPDQERVLGPDHPGTLTTWGDIAGYTAEIQQESRGEPEQPPLAELGRLADAAMAEGDMTEAASYCEQMMAAAEQVLGPEDIRLAGYLRRAARILTATDRDTQAIEALSRTVAINDRYGSETAEAVSDLRKLAGLQRRNGLQQEAQQSLDRARDIETRHTKAVRKNRL